VTFVLFASGVTVRAPSAELQRIEQRRQVTQRYAEQYGVDVRDLDADPTFHRMLSSRAGPHRHLAELQKKKAAALAKQDGR
jgi:hypothetical protein